MIDGNHVEHHTVAEFLEWCVDGRDGKARTWAIKALASTLRRPRCQRIGRRPAVLGSILKGSAASPWSTVSVCDPPGPGAKRRVRGRRHGHRVDGRITGMSG